MLKAQRRQALEVVCIRPHRSVLPVRDQPLAHPAHSTENSAAYFRAVLARHRLDSAGRQLAKELVRQRDFRRRGLGLVHDRRVHRASISTDRRGVGCRRTAYPSPL